MKYPEDLVSIITPDTISEYGINRISELLPHRIPEGVEWRQQKDAKGSRWATRLKKWLYKEHGYKIEPALLADVGEVIKRNTVQGMSLHMFFAPYMVPREFDANTQWGEGRSSWDGKPGWTCWREDYYSTDCHELRDRFFAAGGKCIRVYKSREAWLDDPWHGLGRVFCIQQKGYMFLSNFNCSPVKGSTIIHGIKTLFGYEYHSECDIKVPVGYFDGDGKILGNGLLPSRYKLELK